ncbi:KAT8 regulatory NSL complex subunit 1-like protein isoform 2-T2 [Rhinophrynus dorsalis]
MTPALTETASQAHAAHFSPSLALRSLNTDASSCVDNSKTVEQFRLSKANGPGVVYTDTEQCRQTDFMSLKHVGSQSSANYQTVFLLTSSASLNLQSKSNPSWKMEERDVCRQRFHTKKHTHPLLTGVNFQPERKVKRELFPGTVSQLLADVHKLWDITMTEAQSVGEIHIPRCTLSGREDAEALAIPFNGENASPVLSGLENVSNKSTKVREANSLLLKCLNQQQVLLNRAKRNQKRLQSLLAKHAAEHCSQQIRSFVNLQMQKTKVQDKPARLLDSHPNKETETGLEEASGGTGTDIDLKKGNCHPSTSIRKFSLSATEILRHIELDLDSDATENSSDEDCDGNSVRNQDVCEAEWDWLSIRARVGSCWAWLQAQISEMECKIQQLADLHKRIRSTKGTVMFREPPKGILRMEPRLPDPGTLLNPAGRPPRPPEERSLSPVKDLEMSPSSPTLLLRNIEKQSAQLTEMVSSLIVPVGLSPTNSTKSCGHKRVASGFPNRLYEDGPLSYNGFCEQQQVKRRKRIRDKSTSASWNSSSSSARTRPLHTFYKRKLYRLNSDCPSVLDLFPSEALYPNDESLHITNHSYPWIRSDRQLTHNICKIDPSFHPVLSLPFDLPLHLHLDVLLKNNSDLKTGAVDCTLLKEVDGYPSYGPSGWQKNHTSSYRHQTRYEMRRRRNRHISETKADIHNSVSLNTFMDAASTDTIHSSAQKSSVQGLPSHDLNSRSSPLRRRLRSESPYNIDNIVIPMSLVAPTKVEKLQYKEILTPSWKVVVLEPFETPPEEEVRLEDLSDEAFLSRHEQYEQSEKARWSLWEQSKWPKRNRSSSQSFSVCSGNLLSSSEDCSSPSAYPLDTWSSDTDGSRTPQSADEPQKEKQPPASIGENHCLQTADSRHS